MENFFHYKTYIETDNPTEQSGLLPARRLYYNDMILNKPANKKEAIEHLNILSSNTHQVYTGVFLMVKENDISLSFYEKTDVTFNHLDTNDIEYYTTHCNPYDKKIRRNPFQVFGHRGAIV